MGFNVPECHAAAASPTHSSVFGAYFACTALRSWLTCRQRVVRVIGMHVYIHIHRSTRTSRIVQRPYIQRHTKTRTHTHTHTDTHTLPSRNSRPHTHTHTHTHRAIEKLRCHNLFRNLWIQSVSILLFHANGGSVPCEWVGTYT